MFRNLVIETEPSKRENKVRVYRNAMT